MTKVKKEQVDSAVHCSSMTVDLSNELPIKNLKKSVKFVELSTNKEEETKGLADARLSKSE